MAKQKPYKMVVVEKTMGAGLWSLVFDLSFISTRLIYSSLPRHITNQRHEPVSFARPDLLHA